MARKKIKNATDQRKFTLVYNDFLESDLLNHYEKMVFITLKKYADNETMKAYPSLNKLHKMTGISLSQVRRSIEHMEELGIIGIEHRTSEEKGNQSNLYTLYDYAEIWNVGSSEDLTAVTDEISEMKLVAQLRAMGYTVTKEKGLETTAPTKVTADSSTFQNNPINKDSTTEMKSQDLEKYSLDQVKQLFDYDIMIHDNPDRQQDIDSVINLLHTTLNTTRATIRIAGQAKPSQVVVSKLMKLDYSEIMYALNKYQAQTERIKNPTGYMLTMLYGAKEQMNLDVTNQVRHDMVRWKTEGK